MSLGKLQAALAAASNEVTVAAANINFDFALIKCEAPKEYHVLGEALSKRRKEQAECGSTHITARKLGALFEGVCPATPNLIKAHGTRVSEIAEAAKEFSEPTESIFAGFTGVDGTSIWAAATSSSTALQVQLLACMLARAWNPQEATSIWFELVKERRLEIAKRYENSEEIRFATLTAATQSEISRQNLAEWDASARSWLRTADRIKTRDQKQLMLIVANINLATNPDMAVLSNVVASWKSALELMENLMSGMPQAITSGNALLGLISWHLYPDLLVIGKDPANVKFYDALVSPGGMLTLGLAHAGSRGVRWSLSLKHLQHYGHPVKRVASLDQEFSKITFAQFSQAVFGCLVGTRKSIVHPNEIDAAAHFFISFQAACERTYRETNLPSVHRAYALSFLRDSSHWFNIMGHAARSYLDRTNEERETVQKLVQLGLKRSTCFFHLSESNDENGERKEPYLFGLDDEKIFLQLLKGSEERVAFLRRIAEDSYGCSSSPLPIGHVPIIQYIDQTEEGRKFHSLATALATNQTSKKRKHDTVQNPTFSHTRWSGNTQRKHPEENSYSIHFFPLLKTMLPRPGFMDMLNPQGLPNDDQYSSAYGDPKLAAIYQSPYNQTMIFKRPSYEDISWCLDKNMFSVNDLLEHVNRWLDRRHTDTETMRAVSLIAKVYQVLHNATISVEVLNRPLAMSKWASEVTTLFNSSSFPMTLFGNICFSRPMALSCVAYMESCVDIAPSVLTDAFALAYEDSLYLTMELTCDPSETPQPYELRRVLGNVGRPGVTIMVPPKNPIFRPIDSSSWKFVSTDKFNGRGEDHFQRTSMHISFTDYYVPLFQNDDHNQDHEAMVQETVVSVYDSGDWIGDIDILKALSDDRVYRMDVFDCSGKHQHPYHSTKVSAESWTDILDPPKEVCVVRAHGNWIGRLAVVSVLSQILPRNQGHCIVVCPGKFCWDCDPKCLTDPARQGPIRAFIY